MSPLLMISRQSCWLAVSLALLLSAACGGGSGDSDASPTKDSRSTADSDAGRADGWLYTEGNGIYTSDGTRWRGRGANLHDTRGCNACAYGAPSVDEVKRRVDELVDVWGANFIRLDLESYAAAESRVHWQGPEADAGYLADVQEIVRHIGQKTGVRVMLSLWIHPSFTDRGWPSSETTAVWELLAATFRNDSHVLFGLVNEPQQNYSGAADADVWQAMNQTAAAIRAVEDQAGTPHHIIAVQGTGGWARFLQYYIANPITAGDGGNIAYEVHVYDPEADFQDRFITPSQTLPVIIGEFGPVTDLMTLADAETLMVQARQAQVPHLAWTFHGRCPPNLIVDNSGGGGCGVDMALEPTAWGQLFIDQLAVSW